MTSIHLPPGQQLTAADKWPLVGERLPWQAELPWVLSVEGLVASRREWTLDALRQRTLVDANIDVHCVTRWSRLGMRFRGIPLRALMDEVGPVPEHAAFLSFVARSERNHSTSLPLREALALESLIALEFDGMPIPLEHGGPLRLVVPGKYFYKSLKWLERIEVLEHDRLGYWEANCGYHNGADPWLEQRYIASSVPKNVIRELLARRDFSGQELLSLELPSHVLSELRAWGAILRNANFERCDLRRADFSNTNLTNSRFTGADLREARFIDCDLEGCDFSGADLRGADLNGSSLFGAVFVSETPKRETSTFASLPAVIDGLTRIPPTALEQLVPAQAEFLSTRLSGGAV